MLKLLYAVFAGISSYFISGYLNLNLSYLAALLFFALMLIGKKMDERSDVLSKGNRAILMIFSCLFSLSIVLGDHIHVEDAYSGTIEKNYMLPFDFLDLIAAFFIAFGIYELIKFGFLIINRLAKTIKISFMPENKISIKLVVIIGICIFAAWRFYSMLSLLLAVISTCFFLPVFWDYLKTGEVLQFPTLIVCGFVYLTSIISFFAGGILSSIIEKNRQDFEVNLIQCNNLYKRLIENGNEEK